MGKASRTVEGLGTGDSLSGRQIDPPGGARVLLEHPPTADRGLESQSGGWVGGHLGAPHGRHDVVLGGVAEHGMGGEWHEWSEHDTHVAGGDGRQQQVFGSPDGVERDRRRGDEAVLFMAVEQSCRCRPVGLPPRDVEQNRCEV